MQPPPIVITRPAISLVLQAGAPARIDVEAGEASEIVIERSNIPGPAGEVSRVEAEEIAAAAVGTTDLLTIYILAKS